MMSQGLCVVSDPRQTHKRDDVANDRVGLALKNSIIQGALENGDSLRANGMEALVDQKKEQRFCLLWQTVIAGLGESEFCEKQVNGSKWPLSYQDIFELLNCQVFFVPAFLIYVWLIALIAQIKVVEAFLSLASCFEKCSLIIYNGVSQNNMFKIYLNLYNWLLVLPSTSFCNET